MSELRSRNFRSDRKYSIFFYFLPNFNHFDRFSEVQSSLPRETDILRIRPVLVGRPLNSGSLILIITKVKLYFLAQEQFKQQEFCSVASVVNVLLTII